MPGTRITREATDRLSPDDLAETEWRESVEGFGEMAPLHDGTCRAYVNFDNAATTPPLRVVVQAVNEFLPCYGSVHRGTGHKSIISSRAYDDARAKVAEWLGADPSYHTLLFTRSATDSLNKIARTLGACGGGIVLCTAMEHHSNLLPWRLRARTDHVEIRGDGALDLQQLEEKLRAYKGAVRLVAVTGASNVTGLTPPIHLIARLAHEHGAEVLVDAAQLVSHRAVRMGRADDPEHIDYLVFSAHKTYAPFGVGVLVAPRAVLEKSDPETVGGGSVRLVTTEDAVWAGMPMREEPGTPNVVGAVALAAAIDALKRIGMDRIAEREKRLRARMVKRLKALPGVTICAETAPDDHGQVGIVSFDAAGMPHGLLASALAHEFGVGLRHGCFCAHPYLFRLLKVTSTALGKYRQRALRDDHTDFPGVVRISFGLYNTMEEVDYTACAIERILVEGPACRYVVQQTTGEYLPAADG